MFGIHSRSLLCIFEILLPLLAQHTEENKLTSENMSPVPLEGVRNGFVAEWEYEEEEKTKTLNGIQLEDTQRLLPSERVAPATWFDASGTWWLFGGQSPFNTLDALEAKNQSRDEFMGDLWAYNFGGSRKWTPIFQPGHQTPTPLSSYPEHIQHQILCGSVTHGHLAVFGGLDMKGKPEESDPLLQEDNTVWLYDIPGAQPPGGLWTSYICCDACLPSDQNTTLEFCPHFDQPGGATGKVTPVVWCSTDAIMALQLVPNRRVPEGAPSLDWWKFHLGSTEWIKVAENRGGENISALFQPHCRSASDQDLAYILCPTPSQGGPEAGRSHATREVYVLDTTTNSIRWVSRLTLNVAIDEEGLWENGGSVLAVIKSSDQTLLLIAYKKLLDFWLHDHTSGNFQPLENIWKGKSLNDWQHTGGFYELSITFPFSNASHIVYLTNPRSRVSNWESKESGTWRVRIKPDTGVFLPMRDTDFILQPDTAAGAATAGEPTPETPNWPPSPVPSESQRKFNSEAKPIIPLPHTNPSRITTLRPPPTSKSPGPKGHNESMDPGKEEERGKLDPSPNSTILLTKLKSNLNWTSPEKVQKSSDDSSSHPTQKDERIRRTSKVPAVIHLPLQRGRMRIGKENESNLLIGSEREERHLETTAAAVATTTTTNKTLFYDSTTESGTTVQITTGERSSGTSEPTVDNVLQPENHKRVRRKVASWRKRPNHGERNVRKGGKISGGRSTPHHHKS